MSKSLKTWLYQGEQRTVYELAELLGVSNTTAYERASKGKLDMPVNRLQQQRCMESRAKLEQSGVYRLGALISDGDRYEHDDVCRYVVARSPDGMTLSEIGDLMGVTREAVRQAEMKAVKKIARAVTLPGQIGDDARMFVEMLRMRAEMRRETHWDRMAAIAPGEICLRGWRSEHKGKLNDRARTTMSDARERGARAMAGRTRKAAP